MWDCPKCRIVLLVSGNIVSSNTVNGNLEELELNKEGKPIDKAETLSGTVFYRQRIALPPEAKLVVRLEEVSQADASAVVLAEEVILTKGKQVPIPFTLTYDATQIAPGHCYGVQAQIFYDNRLYWTSTTSYPVLTQDASANLSILLEQVRK